MRPENKKKISFIMNTGKMLHKFGASSDRIEAALVLLSKKLNINSNFFSMPTGIFGSFREPEDLEDDDEFTRLIRLEPGGINLSKLYYVDKTIDRVLDGTITPHEGNKRISQVEAAPPLYSKILEIFSFAFISGSFAVILRGSLNDVIISLFMGLVSGVLYQLARFEQIKRVHEVITPFIAGLITYGIHQYIPDMNTKLVILSSVLYLLPGLDLTTSLSELASFNLTSGTSRLMGALMTLLKISIGVYSATQVAAYLGFASTGNFIQSPYPIVIQFFVILLISLSFVIAFQGRVQDTLWIVFFSMISHFSNLFLTNSFNEIQAPFITGCIIASLSNYVARISNRPSLIFILPSIILLVPGSIGFQGLSFMHEKNFLEGIEIGFKAISIAASIVTGLFVGNLIIRPKRTL